jgi:CDP-paratose 2-epimerase
MPVVIITGSSGLVGSDAVRFFCARGHTVVGIDNDMRKYFFGAEASTRWMRDSLVRDFRNYVHHDADIRDTQAMESIFREYGKDLELVLHTASQPSHDWAAREPLTDFSVNATGTLILLECCRRFTPQAVFIFMSTNKVYGDRPNTLPLVELDSRWELDTSHAYRDGIDESMSIDESKHSLFGASKVAADVLVQEYGRYFGMKTACFRGGCITGPNHSGAQLHGFLSYLIKCVVTGTPYTVFGYKGKQVRDHIHSEDLVNAFFHFYRNPRCGEVYNIGGSRFSHCSVLEAIALCEEVCDKKLSWTYLESHRIGDHIWWVSSVEKFRRHYPEWELQHDLRSTAQEIFDSCTVRWV